MREIYIRKMRYDAAKQKLEREIHAAFIDGETMIQVVHGIGEGKLKQLTEEFVARSDFLKLYNTEKWLIPNPGVTKIEVLGPSKEDLKKYLQ
ncbi:MAG: Smr/MutS family protein [Spirochaetota bacterium]